MKFKVIPFTQAEISLVKEFTDFNIGHNYYTAGDLGNILELSKGQGGKTFSYCLIENQCATKRILGIRFSLPPGSWTKQPSLNLLTKQWGIDPEKVGYFKSLFIDQSIQNSGWGSKLSLLSLDQLKKSGAKAVICHAWLESPGNSSRKYLQKLGFTEIGVHKNFWAPIDYLCSGCKTKPCKCTAAEMILYL